MAPRRLGGLLMALVVAGPLAGCGGGDDNPYHLSEFPRVPAAPSSTSRPVAAGSATEAVPTPPPTPRPTPPPAPSGAVTYTPADAFGQGAWVERGVIRTQDAEERDVAAAVVAYFRARVQISNTWQVDDTRLRQVSTGKALTGARDRAVTQQEAGRRSIGKFVLNLSSVTVDGDRAQVDGCPFDGTSEVDDTGAIIEYPPGGIRYRLDLVKQDGAWLVTTYPTRSVLCEAP